LYNSVYFGVAYDGPELMDIENAAVSPVNTLHIHDIADVPLIGPSGSHLKSSMVQQRKSGSRGVVSDEDDDDNDDDDDDDGASRAHNHLDGDEPLDTDDGSLAAVRSGN